MNYPNIMHDGLAKWWSPEVHLTGSTWCLWSAEYLVGYELEGTKFGSWVFVLSLLGLTPLAERVSFLTEQVAYYTGPAGVYGSTAVLLKQSVLEVLHNDAFDSWGLFVSFLSIILLPIVGNATDFKNKLVPLCVIVAWIMGIKMDLNFNFLETRSLALAIIITTFILHVLLDANFVVELSDLGIPSLAQRSLDSVDTSTICNNSNVRLAYVDPKYFVIGKLTPESDVYSFGVILLQLLTGRPFLGLVRDGVCDGEIEVVILVRSFFLTSNDAVRHVKPFETLYTKELNLTKIVEENIRKEKEELKNMKSFRDKVKEQLFLALDKNE
ncbi:hypothetical protein JHK86_001511 [Glycine max]|nr:hypothetical protein JHK86_001511 [Glycine max]